MPVTCEFCQTHFSKSDAITSRHKSVCVGWQEALGDTRPRPCLCGHQSTSRTQMKRHTNTCQTWQSRDVEQIRQARVVDTLLTTHGVTNVRHIPGVEERRKETIKERYGAENVFAKESSIYEQVREASAAAAVHLYGSDNPFSKPEVREKIRATHLARRGVEYPNQDPEVRAKTRATNLERYGTEEFLAAPAIREQILATNMDKYGGPAPACDPAITEKARQTNLERWGVEWTCQHPEVRRQQLETQIANYGSHFFASEEGRKQIRETLIARYGVDHPTKIEGFWEKAVATFIRKYGATHPLLLAEFLEKRRLTCQDKYGVDSPIQHPEICAKWIETVQAKYEVPYALMAESVKEKGRQTNMANLGVPYALMAESVKEKGRQTNIKNYGVPHPMMNQDYALAHLEKMRQPGPNMLERRFGALNKELLYTGNGSFWRWLPTLNAHKNPDFILPGPIENNPKKSVTKVVEMFGDYWHSRIFTGKANFEHEQDLITAFRHINIDCLVVWEGEFNSDPEAVRNRVVEFLYT